MDKTVNEVRNAYTYYLEEKLNKIRRMAFCDKVSLKAMKGIIKSYIYNARYLYKTKDGAVNYTKKKWFVEQINKQPTKFMLYQLCVNSINKAQRTEAN